MSTTRDIDITGDAAREWISLGQFTLGAEAEIVESLLETFEVPFIRQYDREGAFIHIYLGNSRIPVEIMVPKDRLSEARELLENHIAGSEDACTDTEVNPEPESNNN
jgi:hypothetical protein